jgi:hypothetical protein
VRASYGVDILRGEPWLAEQLSAWEQVNLGLIQSVPQNVVDQLRTQMTQAVSQGTSLRSLKTIVRERLGVADQPGGTDRPGPDREAERGPYRAPADGDRCHLLRVAHDGRRTGACARTDGAQRQGLPVGQAAGGNGPSGATTSGADATRTRFCRR